MGITFYCHCGQKLHVRDEMAGRGGRCPSCGSSLTVPEATPARPAGGVDFAPPPPVVTPTQPAGAALEGTRPCPACGGAILAGAKKCKHCGEYLDPALRAERASEPSATSVAPIPATDGMAIASLVLGILSLPMCLCHVFGAFLGLLALVFGLVSRSTIRRTGREGAGIALAGIVLGTIGLLLGVLWFAFVVLASREPGLQGLTTDGGAG